MCSHWPRKLCVLVLAHHQEILSCLLQSWTLTCLQRWPHLPALLTTVFQASSSRNTWSQAAILPFLSSFSEHGLPLRPLCVCCREDPTRLSPTFCALGHPFPSRVEKWRSFYQELCPFWCFRAWVWCFSLGPSPWAHPFTALVWRSPVHRWDLLSDKLHMSETLYYLLLLLLPLASLAP